jgi:hypothetical protein
MKVLSVSFLTIIFCLLFSGCAGERKERPDDTVTVPDTGYTGIKQYMSGEYLVREVTFKNGVKEGLTKTYYQSGKLRQTFWYENDLRQDSSRWFYEQGELFRTTPYKNDTVDGIQIQYYRNGRLKAKMEYRKGLRTPFLEEYTPDGKLVTGYPDLIADTRDEYKSRGLYRISLSLSDKSTRVRYYRGELWEGVFDTSRVASINAVKGIGHLNLKKTGTKQADHVGVIAEILTNYGNNLIVHKKIDLPYDDLK